MSSLRLHWLFVWMVVLAGCKSRACQMLSSCSPSPTAICHDNARFSALRGRIHGASLEPPVDADLPPTGFPEIFTSSVGSSHAKFFPLPTQPVFPGYAGEGQSSDTTKESGTDSAPQSPEVIPPPPPLPPEDSKDQTGATSPRVWIYDPGRWQSGGTSHPTLDAQSWGNQMGPKKTSLYTREDSEPSWLFQSPPQLSSSTLMDHEPRVVLPNHTFAQPAALRRMATMRR